MDSRRSFNENIITRGTLIKHLIPYMNDTQLRNNPFRRFVHKNQVQDKLSFNLKDASLPSSITPESNKNTASVSDVTEESSVELHSIPNDDESAKIEIEKETPEESKEVTLTRLELSKEIVQNFEIMRCLRLSSIEEVKFKEFNLPNLKSKTTSDKTLLLDLDGTLIYAMNPQLNYSAINISCDKPETVLFKEGSDKVCVKVLIRPYATYLLKELSKTYEIIVYLS